MAPKHLIHDHPSFVVVLDELILANDKTHVREPPMADTHRCPWYENMFVHFSVIGTTFPFMGHILEVSRPLECFDNFFPSCPNEN